MEVKKIFGLYFLTTEHNKSIIRRYVVVDDGVKKKKRSIRYSTKKYAHLKSKKELEDEVLRLNHKLQSKQIGIIKTKLAFLPTSILEEFRVLLLGEIPNEKDARYLYKNLHRYVLSFFVDKCGLADPNTWKSKQSLWGASLMCRLSGEEEKYSIFEREMSFKTIKGIIQLANRFLLFIHEKNPTEILFQKLKPISNASLKDYLARQEMNSEKIGKFISDEDWEIINKRLPQDIAPFIKLGYMYGLRRAETLGLELKNVRNGYLSVEKQLSASDKNNNYTFKPLKDREIRKTPHWFSTKEETHALIKDGMNKRMHPDTLGVKFANLMTILDMDYDLHDLRRTFITRALDYYKPKEVMFAVSHSNIETTMRYLRDDRKVDETVFSPDKKTG